MRIELTKHSGQFPLSGHKSFKNNHMKTHCVGSKDTCLKVIPAISFALVTAAAMPIRIRESFFSFLTHARQPEALLIPDLFNRHRER